MQEKSSIRRPNWNLVMLLFRSQSSLDTQPKSLCESQHNQFFSICIVFLVKSPAVSLGLRRVVKGGFYRSFDLNLNNKKGNVVYFTLAVLLFLVSLALLDAYPTYHQENTGKKYFEKETFEYENVNRIIQFYIWKQLQHDNSLTWCFNPF